MISYPIDSEVSMFNIKQRLSILIAGGLMLAMFAGPGAAHHSAAPFDFTKSVTIAGTVKSFRVANPHTRAVIAVTDAKGTRDVEYEGHSASNFYRAGYTRDALKSGDAVTINIAPRRDGGDGGFIMSFTTAKGLLVGFGGLAPSTGKPEAKAGDAKAEKATP
jgi:Family of unknown function (DUF6152)